MCTVLLPLGVNPIAISKYIISSELNWKVAEIYLFVSVAKSELVLLLLQPKNN